MENTRIVNIWNFIEFTDIWKDCDTSKLDEISPSWFRRKKELEKNSTEYIEFIDKLKRQHAIETGIVERMYDISKGVTETLIEKGFAETLISHGDYSDNLTKDQLMNHLKDHLSAVDFVFDFVKDGRKLTVGFIKELHQVVTNHQEFAEGRDQFGNKHKIPLLKGTFKIYENNPSRQVGAEKIIFKYCHPDHVAAEMDNLILIYENLLQKNVHPLIIAGWFHHAFSIIHPFQDGNGRLARLLASLIFIKFDYFPLTVLREDSKTFYINSLEQADNGLPQPLIDYFIDLQRTNIEKALNLKSIGNTATLDQVTDILSAKLNTQKVQKEKDRILRINENRLELFNISDEILNNYSNNLQKKLKGNANIYLTSCSPSSVEKQFYFTNQIVNFANKFNYFYNRSLPKAWFRFVFEINNQKTYQLIISQHHFGYEDDSYAIAGILEVVEAESESLDIRNLKDENFRKDSNGYIITNVPLEINSYKLSLDTLNIQDRKTNLNSYLQDIVTFTLAQIAEEIS